MAANCQRPRHGKIRRNVPGIYRLVALGGMTALPVFGADTATSTNLAAMAIEPAQQQVWNWHVQNTDIVQGYPAFPAKYSGPNSLPNDGEVRETVSLDLTAGVRLWSGAEAHIDGLMWQGYGVGQTLGVVGFPNGEGFRL